MRAELHDVRPEIPEEPPIGEVLLVNPYHRGGGLYAEVPHVRAAVPLHALEHAVHHSGVLVNEVISGIVANACDVFAQKSGDNNVDVEDQLVRIPPIVVVAGHHEDRHPQLLDIGEVRSGLHAEDQSPQERSVASLGGWIVGLEDVVVEVTGGHDDVEHSGGVKEVGVADEPPETVVPVEHLRCSVGSSRRLEEAAERVDASRHVHVGDVRNPEIGPGRRK